MPTRAEIEHLLRRTEYVARPARVDALAALPTIEACVDDVLSVGANPPTVTFAESQNWQRGVELTHFWLDRMAHDSPRPLQEKMGFFWHGHFCSDLAKVGSAALMRDQVDLFRRDGLGNLRDLAIAMSTQVAMLRYLDNNQNKRTSPNQNFARELVELFLLGVGNYTEADVEAATAAWTGHTDRWDTDQYVWRADWHDPATKSFLGLTINGSAVSAEQHGAETIRAILGDGTVPAGASAAANRGRATRAVAAEFVTRKLWVEFAGTEIPPTVLASVRDVALASDFEIRPWVRALLTRPEFYTDAVARGRVRTPVEYVVGCLVATGRRSADATPLWLMDGMGQRPLYPPNVAGWKHNGYWVNASAMARRTETAQQFVWRSMRGYWNGDGLVHLANGTLSRNEIENVYANDPAGVVDRMLALMGVSVTPSTRQALVTMSSQCSRWERTDLLPLILIAPDFHVA